MAASPTCAVPPNARDERQEIYDEFELLDERRRAHLGADLAWAARHYERTGDDSALHEVIAEIRSALEQARKEQTFPGEPMDRDELAAFFADRYGV